jgi:hypothetical protein
MLLLVDKLPTLVVFADRLPLSVSVLPGCDFLPGRKPCSALPLRTMVTPAGATSSLEAWSWVESPLPLVARGNPRSICWTGQRRRSGVVPFLKALCWLRGVRGPRRWWLCQILPKLRGSGAQCTPSSALLCRLLQVRLGPAIHSLCTALLGA